MDRLEMFGGFSLEADDRTEEERSRQRGAKEGGLAPKAPMDTDYQEDIEEPKCKIRFNLAFDK